jgi:hypothetical protein
LASIELTVAIRATRFGSPSSTAAISSATAAYRSAFSAGRIRSLNASAMAVM